MTRSITLLASCATLALLLLAPPEAGAQSISATNLGGSCGGTIGYPQLQQPGSFLRFRVQRQLCATNASVGPSVLMIGTRTTRYPIPFAQGIVPDCVWFVLPDATVPVAGVIGGEGTSVWLGDVSGVPAGTVLHMQALVSCLSNGSAETSATDAWTLRFH